MRPEERIDREKHCPFLLRVFFSTGAHNRQDSCRAMLLTEAFITGPGN
jgi:hypothetical protein